MYFFPYLDPFSIHFEKEIDEAFVNVLQEKKASNWTTEELKVIFLVFISNFAIYNRFLFWVSTSLLNIWGHIATVPETAVVLWPMCCHTGMPCHRHRTWHPTPSQFTDTGPTCRCAIHWCGTSHWNTQLPILMS